LPLPTRRVPFQLLSATVCANPKYPSSAETSSYTSLSFLSSTFAFLLPPLYVCLGHKIPFIQFYPLLQFCLPPREIIRLSGYTTEERLAIAEAHLVPRVLVAHGLPPGSVSFAPGGLEALIRGWTREAGVRDLERRLAAVSRHLALNLVLRSEASTGNCGAEGSNVRQLKKL
jgi:hypothetical protein